MRLVVVTLFPGLIESYLSQGIVGRAAHRGLFTTELVDPRLFTEDRHRTVDDVPFGGGAGMVMKAEPLARAIESVEPVARRILLTPTGAPFRQVDAERLSRLDSVLFVCGRYEGIDGRVVEQLIDEEVSIGDFVVSGGELGALVVIDALVRLLPGALGNEDSAVHETFTSGLLEHAHYPRPAVWRGHAVPEVLLSGHHAEIERWRRRESLRLTAARRPDLLSRVLLSGEERRYVDALLKREESNDERPDGGREPSAAE